MDRNPTEPTLATTRSGHRVRLSLYLFAPVLIGLAVVGWATIAHPGSAPHTSHSNMPIRVLFVCVENSNRSQMAEAFAHIYGGEGVEAFSAGSRPSGRVNPKAIEAMKELGYDLSVHRSKGLDAFHEQEFDAAITMGCGDECPRVRAYRREDWQLPDPRDMTPDEFRQVRDLIGVKVKALLAEIQSQRSTSDVSAR